MRTRPTESYSTHSQQDIDLDRAVAQYWRKRRLLEEKIYGKPKKCPSQPLHVISEDV